MVHVHTLFFVHFYHMQHIHVHFSAYFICPRASLMYSVYIFLHVHIIVLVHACISLGVYMYM